METWANIPSVILLEIMQYLSRRDRESCSTVCKSWCSAIGNPLLWKYMMVCLDTDLTDPLTVEATKRYAAHIDSLDLAWSKPYLPRRWIRNRMTNVAQDTCHFLMLLKECNVSVTSFKLTDWYFTWKFKKVIYHLTMFLRQQRNLKYLSLTNAYLNKTEILKILFSCRYSGPNITYLDLQSSFHEWHNVTTNSNFMAALQQFTNLEILKLDYSSLSDRTLMALLESGNRSIKFLKISVKDVDSRSHGISSDMWARLVANCRDVKVGLYFQNICHFEDIYYILVDTMPLHTFVLNCGHVWDQSRSRNYCGTLNLLINNYENTLTHVTLQLRNNREMLDYYMYEMIRKCKSLQYLEYDGVLRTIDLLRDFCILLCNDEHSFKFFHVRPKNTTIHNNLVISDIWRCYMKRMLEYDINFEVESFNSTTVRIFC